MPLIRFSINNPLLTNLMLGIVVILGVLSWQAMPQEMFPAIELDAVSINVEFEGASPEEVERQITIPIEEEFDGMPEIDVMNSTSREGMASVMIKLKSGTDVDQYMRDAQTAIDQITDLPDEAEEPELVRLKARFPVISMTLYGDVARGYLYDLADDVKQRMLALPGVAAVGVAGDRDWEIWVEVDPYRLAARDLFSRADFLLTDFKVRSCGKDDLSEVPAWAGGMLVQTRLLMDTDVAEDVEMKILLDELELVLAQIVGLSRDNCARDMAWIRRGLQERDTIDRLRTVSAGSQI